ncbi:MAG: carbohydrate kinase family protein, partial [Clostridia bacterium]|nr:carbohydrate kinase family protein [Clostridia bacterium]
DYLMTDCGRGIAIFGNLLTDIVKMISSYPEKGMLSNISSISRAVGGCVPNVAIDLAKIDHTLPIYAYGRVGSDEGGSYVTLELQKNGIDITRLVLSEDVQTGFSDVMTVERTGERTFFHYQGTNRYFSPADIVELNCDILHIGYILLLPEFDREDPEYGTVMARFLKGVQEKGIKTSIDVVSDSEGRFREKVLPALRYCDYAVMNEIEGCSVSGLEPRYADGSLNIENMRKTMELFIDSGVRDTVVLHCPEAGFAMTQDKSFYVVPSLDLPEGFIKGTVGAGDAFCAGCLYGLYRGFEPEKMLEFAAGAAAFNLTAADSVSGMRSRDEILEFCANMPKRKFD